MVLKRGINKVMKEKILPMLVIVLAVLVLFLYCLPIFNLNIHIHNLNQSAQKYRVILNKKIILEYNIIEYDKDFGYRVYGKKKVEVNFNDKDSLWILDSEGNKIAKIETDSLSCIDFLNQ